MRKLILTLAILLLAVAAYADTTILRRSGGSSTATGYINLGSPHRYGSGTTQQTTTTASTYAQALFGFDTDKATNYVDYWFIVPPDLDTSVALTLAYFAFESSGAIGATETVHWILSVVSIADNALFNGTPATAIDCTYTASGAHHANDVHIKSGVTLTGWAAALTPGQLCEVRLERDADNDADDSCEQGTYSGPICISYGKVQ